MKFIGLAAPSGVSEQPMTNYETLTGANNRALYCREEEPGANYWVGVEGGLTRMMQ